MARRHVSQLSVLLGFGGLSNLAFAVALQGTADYGLALRTGGGDVQKSELVLTPRLDFNLGESAQTTLIVRGRFDGVDELSPGQPTQRTRSHWNRRAYLGDNADLELREFYVDANVDDLFVRLGKQQVVWGQADGLRVLDVLNPIDYREFILPEVDNRRIPLWMINAESPLGAGMLQLIMIPDQTYDELPPFDGAFAFSSRLLVPSAPANVPVAIRDHDRPASPLKDADAGLRWQTFLGGWDLTLNYLYHYQDQAVFYLAQEQNRVLVKPTYQRSHLLGATFSNAFGDFALRGELGYSTDRYWVADPARVDDGVVRSPELAYVFGLDYSGVSDTFISSQLFQSYLTQRPSGAIREPAETQVTALVRRNVWNDALALEAFVIQSINDNDGLLQMEARYQFTSDLSGRVGADLFYGDDTGLFGQFRSANRVHVGLTYAF
jgi:hypothetical protein